MSHQYAQRGQSSWNEWWWQALEEKCEWLREAWNSQTAHMQCLEEEVARLGEESNELTQRVEEVEGQKAWLLDAIAELRREVDDFVWIRYFPSHDVRRNRCRSETTIFYFP